MDLELTGPEALRNSKLNIARSWITVRQRFESGEPMPVHHTPKFTFTGDTPIFTVGSCFARAIEFVLEANGVPLLLAGHGVPVEDFESWNPDKGRKVGAGLAGRLSRGALHKYNVHSIAHDLRRVLLNERYPNEGLIEFGPDRWFDPHASGLRPASLETAIQNRRRLEDATGTIRRAGVVFMTLGLTETWIDLETGLAMNRPPGGRDLVAHQKRFKFVDFGFRSIIQELEKSIALIRETCNPDMRFIVTVSPVPLGATFRSNDVLVSVSASKAALRAVAEELSRNHDCVDYFPSYEMVMNSPRDIAWKPDKIHVQTQMVRHVTSTFMRLYFGASLDRLVEGNGTEPTDEDDIA